MKNRFPRAKQQYFTITQSELSHVKNLHLYGGMGGFMQAMQLFFIVSIIKST